MHVDIFEKCMPSIFYNVVLMCANAITYIPIVASQLRDPP